MKHSLLLNAAGKLIGGFVIIGLLLFLSAGTLRYPHGWLLMITLFGPMLLLGVVLLLHSPKLLGKRLDAKEKMEEQKRVIALTGVMFVASFVVAGLNFRYGWMALPLWVVWTGVGTFLLFYLMYAEVMRENTYLTRTIEVQEGQKVVDRGLYGIVRHPMYSATLLMFLSMPLILGSPISLFISLAYFPIIAARIRSEERLLEEELDGYKEYKQRVRYKVIPFIW